MEITTILIGLVIVALVSYKIDNSSKKPLETPKKTMEDVCFEKTKRLIKTIQRVEDSEFTDRFKKEEIEHAKNTIENAAKAFITPDKKEKTIYHGACLNCIAPEAIGVGECTKCMYFASQWSLGSREIPPSIDALDHKRKPNIN